MKHTSFSIAELMVLVAIFALDCVIMRATDPGPILVFCSRRVADARCPGDRSAAHV